MPDEIRVNRPPTQPNMRPEPMEPMETKQGSSKAPWLILAVIVLALIVCAVAFRNQLFNKPKTSEKSAAMSASAYQAVFLTNGQVYFGALSGPNNDYVTLKDIYYLQVGPQQGSAQPNQPAPQQSISLVKLGNELHGPVDEMHISRSQVLFYEDLKPDGQVVKAILQDKSTKK